MSKLPANLENPIDLVLINSCDKIAPYFHKTGHTPNIITTYSLIFGLLAINAIYAGSPNTYVIYMIISYFFDCLDGHMARKYNQVSRLGDLYDHVKDNILLLATLILALKGSSRKNVLISVIFIFIVGCVTLKHLGCQQHHFDGENDETLDYLKKLCPVPSDIKYTRFIGTATFNMLFIAVIYCNITKPRSDSFAGTLL